MITQVIREPTLDTGLDRLDGASAIFNAASLVKIYPLNAHEGLIRLPPARFLIGRDSQSDLWIDDVSISRCHACIQPIIGGFQVTDLESTNGTFINDKRITSARLIAGDQLRFGNHIYKALGSSDIEGQFLETVYTRMIRDGLTGAYNKRYLTESLERDVKRSLRHDRPLSVAAMDIDHFKAINDTYGHLIGDEVLREFSRRLMAVARQDDVFARCGGEEFVMVMCETPNELAILAAESFRRVIADEPFATSSTAFPVTMSVGVASTAVGTELTPNDLLAAADRMLYQAKREGRNRVAGWATV
jgi:two-component system cell cycle response regulator